jgi:hypothetical protein
VTDDRRPRSRATGYPGPDQQLDPAVARGAGVDRPARHDHDGPAPNRQADPEDATVALIDLSAPRRAPAERRGPGPVGKTVLALAALGVMVAGGTGYVLLRGTGSDDPAVASVRRSAEPSVPPPAQPGDTTVPHGEPVHTVPASPAPTTTISGRPVRPSARPVRSVAPVEGAAPHRPADRTRRRR